MRFVGDAYAEASLLQLRDQLATQVVGCDHNVALWVQRLLPFAEHLDAVRAQMRQPFQDLIAPAKAQRRRTDNEQRPLCSVQVAYRDRLQRFTDTHFVAEQEASMTSNSKQHSFALKIKKVFFE